ncbi:MAG: hypothetical protein HOD92_21705 [Deltaproteobacteria bacterium]|jgi:hypothetical protein|nr:hypothetical protein [Deltaproteobacteria bacterium]
MSVNKDKWTMRERVLAVLKGELPDRLPFIDRIEIWYNSMLAGKAIVEYKTPVGTVSVSYVFSKSMIVLNGMEPYLTEHLIKDTDDYRTIEYILERADFVPLY